ncbi:MAG: FAD-dependent oxidoreductase [Clostridia bacterium]|nr:FAD-dependent oxidoreductase [Clostridia bacterium]
MEFTTQIKKTLCCDVLVVGGGVAGFSAAVSASRCGMNVILAEQGGYLGGTATAGLVAPFMTCYDTKGEKQIIRGIFKETIDCLIKIDGAKNPSECRKCDSYSGYKLKGHLGTTPYDREKLKFVMEQMCEESGVQLKYHFTLVGVNVSEKHIRSCVFATKNGFYEIEAKQFIDCSGDADLCYLAGGEYEFSDETNQLQPVSTFMLIDGVDKQAMDRAVLDKDARGRAFMDIVEDEKREGRFPCGTKKVRIYEQMNGVWAVNMCQIDEPFDVTDPELVTKAEIEGRKQASVIFDMLRRRIPGMQNIRLLQTSETLGIRESRRIVGEYKLTLDDMLASVVFEDAIAVVASSVDVHTNGAVDYKPFANDRPYTIPYRALVHKDFDNLLGAGKIISSDRYAHGAVRVMPPAMATGQAAGVGAVLGVKYGTKAKDVDIAELKEVLKGQGAYLY